MEITKAELQNLLLNLINALKPLAIKREESRFPIPRASSPIPDEKLYRERSVQELHVVQKKIAEVVLSQPESKKEAPLVKTKPAAQVVLAKQAHMLIQQVQEAIGELCSSSFFKEPKKEPLSFALKRLKPELDRLIEDLAKHEALDSDERERPQTGFRLPLPRPQRAHLFSREPVPFAHGEKSREGRGEAPILSTLRGVLAATPVAPFTAARPIASYRKKKKRDAFWFRSKEEDFRDAP